ncbi:DeoR/GlpR family DNA-binding transcription regulator [Aureimonas sp. AU20]|uniref:DeoR/GlpR family DNA-binding transcription regulator n=1 Tax=Aureimonas sp. AU20 TaxID=1349819 RepID=UPI00072150A3|nr:DeoR/GlpR family DNA-binding transcription regulator [Aureimonas sp. AU20]ALN75438.1 hypothetical protein M673_22110 [Aureimonas sp. AU20]
MAKNASSLPARRRANMLELIGRDGSVSVPDLAERFAVSLDTVRRDLDHLARSGALVRAHGGALRVSQGDPLKPLADRVLDQSSEKAAIAKLCAKQVRNGETLMLNGGSTTLLVAEALADHAQTVVFTNNLALPASLAPGHFAALHVLGGEYRALTRVSVGPLLFANSERINIDTAIIGVRAIHADNGILTSDLAEASMIADMMALARRTIVVADASKFGQYAFATIAPLSAIDILVTDRAPDGALAEALRGADVSVVTPG